MQKLLPVLILFISLAGCKKDKRDGAKEIEFYTLKSYQLVAGKCQVDASTAVTEDQPFVFNNDILQYVKNKHEYRLTANAIQSISALPPRTAFAVTLNKEIIFLGIYMPMFLSSTCDHSITLFTLDNTAYIQLGYPGWIQTAAPAIDDLRNNPSLLAALKAQGKLR